MRGLEASLTLKAYLKKEQSLKSAEPLRCFTYFVFLKINSVTYTELAVSLRISTP